MYCLQQKDGPAPNFIQIALKLRLVCIETDRRTWLYRLNSSSWSRIYIYFYGVCEASFYSFQTWWQNYTTLCKGIKSQNSDACCLQIFLAKCIYFIQIWFIY